MKTKFSAAIASLMVSFAIVCGISAYAYPGMSAPRLDKMAKKNAITAQVVMPAVLRLPASCKGCAPG